jgi:hypothetical protein
LFKLAVDSYNFSNEAVTLALNKFNEEYVNASIDRKDRKNNLHKSKDLVKDCYDRNNARNRDVLTRVKATGEDYTLRETETYNPEDQIIENIDRKKKSTS